MKIRPETIEHLPVRANFHSPLPKKEMFMKRCLLMVVLAAISAAGLWGQTLITLPDDYYRLDELEGTVVELRQRMYVVDNSSWNRYGEVTLASERLQSPTEVALPGSAEYFELVEHNASCCIVLDDANTAQYPSPRPWASADGTLRTGAYTDYVKGRLTKEKWGYTINPLAVSDIVFEGNERPAAPADMGECDVTICGFNLQYYMVDEFDGKMGPADQEEATASTRRLWRPDRHRRRHIRAG